MNRETEWSCKYCCNCCTQNKDKYCGRPWVECLTCYGICYENSCLDNSCNTTTNKKYFGTFRDYENCVDYFAIDDCVCLPFFWLYNCYNVVCCITVKPLDICCLNLQKCYNSCCTIKMK